MAVALACRDWCGWVSTNTLAKSRDERNRHIDVSVNSAEIGGNWRGKPQPAFDRIVLSQAC